MEVRTDLDSIFSLKYIENTGGILRRRRLAYLEQNTLTGKVDFIHARGIREEDVYPCKYGKRTT